MHKIMEWLSIICSRMLSCDIPIFIMTLCMFSIFYQDEASSCKKMRTKDSTDTTTSVEEPSTSRGREVTVQDIMSDNNSSVVEAEVAIEVPSSVLSTGDEEEEGLFGDSTFTCDDNLDDSA